MIAALRPFSRLVRVPDNLESVTERGEEVPDREAGLKPGTAEALWQRARALYATGVQPGMQLCVRHGGKIVLNRAIGHARGNAPGEDGRQAVPMRLGTPINLFSAGKAVTAMLMHKLQEQNLLKLDDPVAKYLPGFERHGKQAITLRQVLTHRAGIAQLPASVTKNFHLAPLSQPELLRELLCELRPGKIGGAPAYHAISGGFVMAEVIRAITGRDPRELLETLLKKPLGLRWLDFGVRPQQVGEVALNAVTGYIPAPIRWQLSRIIGADFNEAVRKSNDADFLTALVPSGNVMTTAQDIAALYQCLLDGGLWNGQRIFERSTVEQAREPDRKDATIDRTIGIPIRYSRGGFMIGHGGLGLFGWNRPDTFGHLGLSSTLTWARPDTGTVIAWVTTGKPILGPHIPEMLAMFSGLNALCENRLMP